jgi:hypothetical protein
MMTRRREVQLVGYGALAIATVLVIMALLLARPAARIGAGNQATPSPVLTTAPPPVPPHTRMVRTERFIDYPTPTEQERAAGIEMLRVAFAAQDGAIGSLPAWWVAETRYLPPLPPERPSGAPAAAAGPSVVQKEADRQETDRPQSLWKDRAACSRHGLKTVWQGQYRWRCRR